MGEAIVMIDPVRAREVKRIADVLDVDFSTVVEMAITLFCNTYSAEYLQEKMDEVWELMNVGKNRWHFEKTIASYLICRIMGSITDEDIKKDFEAMNEADWEV